MDNQNLSALVDFKGNNKKVILPFTESNIVGFEERTPENEPFIDKETIFDYFCERTAIRDVCRGIITIEKNRVIFTANGKVAKTLRKTQFKDRFPKQALKDNKKSIVLLIPSPLFSDYNEDFRPLAPLQEDAGNQVIFYLSNVIQDAFSKGLVKEGKYSLIISSIVPWDCSMYYFHETLPYDRKGISEMSVEELQDFVLDTLYDVDFLKDYYIKRLKSYNPSLILSELPLDSAPLEDISKALKKTKVVRTIPLYEWTDFIVDIM